MESDTSCSCPPSLSRGLESLPVELLVEIAHHLELSDSNKHTNVRSLSLVSKKLLSACNQACSTLSLTGPKASRLPRLLTRFHDLTTLNLSFDCSEDALALVGRLCPLLRKLHVPETCKATGGGSIRAGQGLLSVCQGCPNLEVLSLPWYKGPGEALLGLRAAAHLRVLELKGAQSLSDGAVKHIAEHCSHIQVLDLSFNAISDAALESLGEFLPHLKRLDLKHCKRASGAGIASIAQGCLKLQSLHLGVMELDNAALMALGHCSKNLEELSLDYGASRLGPFSQNAMAALAQGCSRLRVLSLRGSKQVNDESLKGLARGCPVLQELDLHACTNVGDVGLHSVIMGCKELQVLVLTGTSVGSAGLSTFDGELPCLRSLRLNGDKITDSVLTSISHACSALKELHLNGCRVSDQGLKLLLEHCLKLNTLVLKSCGDLKATAFEALSLPLLHTVQFPSCGVTDQGVVALSHAAPSLTTLNVSSCLKLSAEGCGTAVHACTSLTNLIATGCPQFTREDIISLTRIGRASLKLLRVSRPGSLDDEYTLKRQSAGWSLPCWARGTIGASITWKL